MRGGCWFVASRRFVPGSGAGLLARRPLLIWLGVTLAFFFCLGGFWAFHSLPRFLLLGAPAAILLAAAPLALLPFFVGLVELAQADSLMRRVWGEGYFSRASRELR